MGSPPVGRCRSSTRRTSRSVQRWCSGPPAVGPPSGSRRCWASAARWSPRRSAVSGPRPSSSRGPRRDPLTDLPDRAHYLARLEELCQEAPASSGPAVIFMDLDRFNVINDSLGHEAGDRLLRSPPAGSPTRSVPGRWWRALAATSSRASFPTPRRPRRCGGPSSSWRCSTSRWWSAAARSSSTPLREWSARARGISTPTSWSSTPTPRSTRAKELGRGQAAVFDDAMKARRARSTGGGARAAHRAARAPARRPLPTAVHHRRIPGRRCRSPRPLAPPPVGPHPAEPLHQHRRGDRGDRPGHRGGAGGQLRAGPVARRGGGELRRPHLGQPLRRPSSRTRASSPSSPGYWASTGSPAPSSASRSRRAR